jgi:hypothetical protein
LDLPEHKPKLNMDWRKKRSQLDGMHLKFIASCVMSLSHLRSCQQ